MGNQQVQYQQPQKTNLAQRAFKTAVSMFNPAHNITYGQGGQGKDGQSRYLQELMNYNQEPAGTNRMIIESQRRGIWMVVI